MKKLIIKLHSSRVTTKTQSSYDEVLVFQNEEGVTVDLYKESGKWIEGNSSEELYGFGSKTYMSYLEPSDIADYLTSDYGGRWTLLEDGSY